jgi:hypothetical protein
MKNMTAEIGQKLLPVSMKITQIKLALAKAISERLVPALGMAQQWIKDKVVPALQDLAAWAKERLIPIVQNLAAFFQRNLLPGLEALGRVLVGTVIPAIGRLIDFLVRNQDLLAAIGVAIIATLVPAFVAWAAAAAAAAASTLLAIAPIVLIGAAIAALAYLIIHNWDTIKRATQVAFDAVVGFIRRAIDWVKTNWPYLLAVLTGPIGMAVLVINKHWDKIKAGATAAKDWIVTKFMAMVHFVGSLGTLMAAGARNLWGWLTNGLLSALNWIIRQINKALDAIDRAAGPYVNFGSIPQVGGGGSGGSVSYKRPPRRMASGGISGAAGGGVRSRLTMLGEHGRELAELPPGTRVHGHADTERMLARGGGGGGSVLVIDSSGATGLDALFFRWLREKIKSDHGGDVQAALGRG